MGIKEIINNIFYIKIILSFFSLTFFFLHPCLANLMPSLCRNCRLRRNIEISKFFKVLNNKGFPEKLVVRGTIGKLESAWDELTCKYKFLHCEKESYKIGGIESFHSFCQRELESALRLEAFLEILDIYPILSITVCPINDLVLKRDQNQFNEIFLGN